MPLLRPSRPSLSRPSIHELSAFLLYPQTYTARCNSSLARSRRHTKPQAYTHPPHSLIATRGLSTKSRLLSAPKSHDRGPISEESTQTDFGSLNVLGGTPAPSTSIDACLSNGFHLNSGVKIVDAGVLLVAGEAFSFRPWEAGAADGLGSSRLVNEKGQWEVSDEAWGLLGLVWPKPDLLILGLGKEMRPLSPKTRQYLNSLGVRIDIQDTRNAAAQFNLLATERGVGSVAAALIPLGWKEGVGIR
ncbi:hypothetical protein D0Z07_4815 [Hyphodiscus hymeniophilus]|uniref:NADH dehydrogenase [ubiquinone] 1 alpha subcomplex assembly factor 3 n=1 Tax=Hyphodiscus hymeniophilus TaxID=353542 RepID=A0A9P6VIT3_9HELO|nr:hypothetical protein D0Z07_4815 [Hyphodiscus hymeniophilus]